MTTLQVSWCCQNTKAYAITYGAKNRKDKVIQVCPSCFDAEIRSENYPDTLIKPFQKNILELVCISCNADVKKAMGCSTCHPEKPDTGGKDRMSDIPAAADGHKGFGKRARKHSRGNGK